MMAPTSSTIATTAIIAALAGSAPGAHAGTTTYTLNRTSLDGVDDTNGTTQQEGGTFKNAGGTAIGHYNLTRRSTQGGSSALNAASETLTLIFPSKSGPTPLAIVIEGVHSFSSGGLTGSVSAASALYRFVRNADAAYTNPSSGVQKLTLKWTGTQTLP